MRVVMESTESAYPPLSLRDISPTRGEIGGSLPLVSAKQANTSSTYAMLVWGKMAPRVTNLPPCGGDVTSVTEGGGAGTAYSEVSVP
ncbi:hypothetical protein PMI03_04833 [Rhizobium sp. AP16]|nr:hypothetical protein PMI03_04833 [Rhizobium sp. AP16]